MDITPGDGGAPIFNARLTPHRSLNRNGFRALMAATFAASAVVSLPFYLMGAWPIVGFMGLDVARVNAAGLKREWKFIPAWVRLERVDHEEFGIQRLSLHMRGRRWDIARFLGPDQKAEFATHFTKALAEARRGPRYSD